MIAAKFLLIAALAAVALAADRKVAITFDDLPFAQSGKTTCDPAKMRERTEKLLNHFKIHQVPATGFVIANGCKDTPEPDRIDVMKMWQKSGQALENHTWSHPNFNNVTIDEYTAGIERAGAWLRKNLGIERGAFFRSPYLHIGDTEEKKAALERYLKASGLRQGIVTIDNSDWLFANVYGRAKDGSDEALAARVASEYMKYMESVTVFFERRAKEVVGREIPQVLLVHANWLNADHFDKILDMFRSRGYKFVSLAEAMKDPAYQLKDGYTGTNGISWIHRWGDAKGMPRVWEPNEPKWLLDEDKRLRESAN